MFLVAAQYTKPKVDRYTVNQIFSDHRKGVHSVSGDVTSARTPKGGLTPNFGLGLLPANGVVTYASPSSGR